MVQGGRLVRTRENQLLCDAKEKVVCKACIEDSSIVSQSRLSRSLLCLSAPLPLPGAMVGVGKLLAGRFVHKRDVARLSCPICCVLN